MSEKEEQRYGRNKNTLVNKEYLNKGEYRKKFDSISDSAELNRLLYRLAKKMLIHRSGTEYEDMYWIDPLELKVVAKETDGVLERKITYSNYTKQIIREHQGLITIHSHPHSMPPSIVDLNANHLRQYSLGIVVGHDGKVFVYRSGELISQGYYSLLVADYVIQGYNEYEAQVKALEKCSEGFDISVKEVTGYDD